MTNVAEQNGEVVERLIAYREQVLSSLGVPRP